MDKIIVYRNPLEAQVWETFSNNPEYILYGLEIASVIVFLMIVAQKIKDSITRKKYHKNF